MSILFDSTSSLSTVSNVTPPDNSTVCFWMNLTSVADQRFGGTGASYEVRLVSTNLVNKMHSKTGLTSGTAIAINTLYHVAFTCNRVGNAHQIFLNGVLNTTGSTVNAAAGAALFTVGSRTGSNQRTQGSLEDFRIYNRILSANEIEAIYGCRGSDNIVSGLLNRWVLNDLAEGVTVVSNVIDHSDTKNNLTQFSDPVYSQSFISMNRSAF